MLCVVCQEVALLLKELVGPDVQTDLFVLRAEAAVLAKDLSELLLHGDHFDDVIEVQLVLFAEEMLLHKFLPAVLLLHLTLFSSLPDQKLLYGLEETHLLRNGLADGTLELHDGRRHGWRLVHGVARNRRLTSR